MRETGAARVRETGAALATLLDAERPADLAPGRVHFSARSHLPLDLRAAPTALLPDAGPDFAAGHDRATGGILGADVFDELLRRVQGEAARGAAA